MFYPDAIRRILENLLSNAIKYGDSSQFITVNAQAFNELVIIKVHNFGNPIKVEDQKTIFEEFERIDTHHLFLLW